MGYLWHKAQWGGVPNPNKLIFCAFPIVHFNPLLYSECSTPEYSGRFLALFISRETARKNINSREKIARLRDLFLRKV